MHQVRLIRGLVPAMALVLIAGLSRAASPAPPATIAATGGAEAIEVDGRLLEDVWESGRWHTDFRVLDAPEQLAAAQTRFKICRNSQYAYIGIVLDEPEPDKIQAVKAERDGNVYSQDCVEIMLDPNPDADVYYHFVVNSRGCLYDSQVRSAGGLSDRTWNGRVTWASHVGPRSWSVELAIPFAQLELNPDRPGAWRCNVTRSRRTAATRVLSSFVPINGSFHQPELFAPLRFEGTDLTSHLWQIDPPFDVRVTPAATGLQMVCSMMVRNRTGTFRFLTMEANHSTTAPEAKPVGVAGGLDAGQTLKFDLAGIAVDQGAGLLTIKLCDRLEPERPLALRSFPLDVRYTALDISLVKPFYRDSIFATETLAEIVANVRIDLPAERFTDCELRTHLIPQDDANPIASDTRVAKTDQQIRLPIPMLDVGRYVLSAELVQPDNKGAPPLAIASRDIRKLPPADHEWRIRDDCVVLYNGKPFVPFGFFSVPTNEYREVAAAGHTALQWYCAQYKRTRESLFEALDEVNDAGLKMMFYPYPNDRYWLASYKRIYEPMTAKEQDALAVRVSSIKDHPAILGYYLFDEPSCHTVLPARARRCYEICREEDPYHPCIVLCQNPSAMFTFREACDIHMPDPYPGFMYRGLAARDMRVVRTYIETAVKAGRGRQAVWFTPQAFHWRRPNQRAPRFRELRNMVWQGIIYGATGVVAYKAERWDPDIRLGMDFLAGEVRDLQAAVIAGDAPEAIQATADTPDHFHCSARRIGEALCLLACSTATEPQTVTFTFPDGAAPEQLYAISEKRTLKLPKGPFSDSFDTYGVHLYTTDAAIAKRATVAATQAKIDSLRAPKSGNLLHELAGTVVTTSNDAREAYDVIDSQTVFVPKRTGWLVERTQQGPHRLALRLPKPASIGRIVLYAHGVRECDVEVLEEDKWRRASGVKPGDAGPCEIRFGAVTTSGVRLTVTEFEGDSFQVYEVEGYAQ